MDIKVGSLCTRKVYTTTTAVSRLNLNQRQVDSHILASFTLVIREGGVVQRDSGVNHHTGKLKDNILDI